MDPNVRPSLNPVFDEKVGVLEIAKQPKVDNKRHPQPPFRGPASGFFRSISGNLTGVGIGDLQPHGKIYKGRERDEAQEPPVPPTVEHVTRDQKEHVLRLQTTWSIRPKVQNPICRKDCREKEQEFEGVEEHQLPF